MLNILHSVINYKSIAFTMCKDTTFPEIEKLFFYNIIRNYHNHASERHNLNNPIQAKRGVGHENQSYNSVSERRDFRKMQIGG